jgi:hypothetical protein
MGDRPRKLLARPNESGTPVTVRPRRIVIPPWTFLSNHAHVLLITSAEPEVRLRDVAARIGITERAVQRIVADLVASNYLERERVGRRNRYRVHPEVPMRHPMLSHNDVGALFKLLRRSGSVTTG